MKKTVLLVDDFRISNDILSKLIADENFEIISVQNPESAIKLLEKIKFDIIITDYQMPVMTGLDLVKRIKAIDGYENTPVIILSSLKSEELKNTARQQNITAWLDKPVTVEQAKAIKKFINNI